MKRFSVTNAHGHGPTEFKQDPNGTLVRIEDVRELVRPLHRAASKISLYGATVARLQALEEALKAFDNGDISE
jgi:hypothetical protein